MTFRGAFPPWLGRVRDGVILLGCGLLVALGARDRTDGPVAGAGAPPTPSSPAGVEQPLPSGAAVAVADRTAALGAHGCSYEDRGNGEFRMVKAGGAKLWVRPSVVRPDGGYDLVLHLHGGEAVRRILAPRTSDLFFATIDRGDSSADYTATFPSRRAWDDLIAGLDKAASDALGTPAHARRIAVSSFSAGFAAVDEALGVAAADVSGVILLDSLYASHVRDGSGTRPAPVPRFVAAARRALESDRATFALTYSQIRTPDYASTSEVAKALLEELVVRADRVDSPRDGLALERVAEERGFVVRGYAGTDAPAHCAHLGLLPELLDVWRTHR